jgi:hypothetical protein
MGIPTLCKNMSFTESIVEDAALKCQRPPVRRPQMLLQHMVDKLAKAYTRTLGQVNK